MSGEDPRYGKDVVLESFAVLTDASYRYHNNRSWNSSNITRPADCMWTPSRGIHCAPLPEANITQTTSSNVNVCPHFARGNCKWSDTCKKSHDMTTTQSRNESSRSKPAQKVNDILQELFRYFNQIESQTSAELQYGDNLECIGNDIGNRAESLRQACIFAKGSDLLHSNIADVRVQNAVTNLRHGGQMSLALW